MSLACPYDPKLPHSKLSQLHSPQLIAQSISNLQRVFVPPDELIRQVTIGCIEQGLLLYRVRNEIWHTIDCYKKAYESGVIFGLNKAVKAELALNSRDRHGAKVRFDKLNHIIID